MSEESTVIPLASSEAEAFEHFRILAQDGVIEARGEHVEIDLGNYVHVLDKEERLEQITWIAPTLREPDYIIRLAGSKRRGRPRTAENYMKWIRAGVEEDENVFIVAVERVGKGRRLRTWFAPFRREDYLHDLLKRGEVIWQAKE